MGRRALRKIDPHLDLSHHLTTVDDLPSPWNSEALFGRAAPLEVEVGSGKGLFLGTAARQRPDVDFLGIEVVRKYARFSAAALAKQSLPNAVLVAGDATLVFGQFLPAGGVAAVHIYFPDPWWKKRHEKRRVMQAAFVADIERTLQPGGRLHFWTDVDDYFRIALDLLAAHTNLSAPRDVPEIPPEHDMDYRTHFERRTRKHGEAVFRAEFVKPAD